LSPVTSRAPEPILPHHAPVRHSGGLACHDASSPPASPAPRLISHLTSLAAATPG